MSTENTNAGPCLLSGLSSIVAAFALAAAAIAVTSAQTAEHAADAARRKAFDAILDTYVRDGMVYYRALKADHARLDSYLAQVASEPVDRLSNDGQIAFWLNAYDALVLKTVIDHYPIQGRAPQYPARSVRQIPGAFEKLQHRAGGRMVTLDEMEQTILAGFHDPRLYFAIGRGSVGGGRLRSEAYSPDRLEQQLAAVASECASRTECIQVDREQNTFGVSAIFSWREKDFTEKYAGAVHEPFEERTDRERAVLGFVWPKLLTTEKDFLTKNQWQMTYLKYDWALNDLTGRGGR
jgi:hypothetical protein